MVKVGVMSDRGEQIQYLAVVGGGITNSVGRENRQAYGTSDPDCDLVAPLLFTFRVPLKLDVDVAGTEGSNQSFDHLSACFFAIVNDGCGQRTFIASGKANQAARIFLNIPQMGRPFTF